MEHKRSINMCDFDNKKIYVYGIGRRQKTFEYVFDSLRVEGYIDDAYLGDTWMGKPLWTSGQFVDDIYSEDSVAVICNGNKDVFSQAMKKSQITAEKNIFLAAELFFLLDTPRQREIHEKRMPVVLWGTGNVAKDFMNLMSDYYDVKFFLDNNENKSSFCDLAVKHPARIAIEELQDKLIIIAVASWTEIAEQLREMGVSEDNYINSQAMTAPSVLMEKVFGDDNFYALECYSMLNDLDVGACGLCSNCCATFLKARIGELLTNEFSDIWGTTIHKILCVSSLNHSFTFCISDLCPALLNKQPVRYKENYDESSYPSISSHPNVVNVAIDNTCNLYCESCRRAIMVANKEREQKEIETLSKKLLADVLPYVDFITMAGNGEVFLSKSYENLFSADESKHAKYFQILSNGTLFTENKWSKLTDGRTSDILFCVSIDAATEETYKILRRGGNFAQLLKALSLVGELRKQGKIKYFRMNFVVQRQNYLQMPKFVAMAKKFNADRVLFTRILNWGTYTNDEYNKRSMVDKDGNPLPELAKVLNDSLCQDSIVDLGTFTGKHNYTDTDKLYNYYLWEIENYSGMSIQENIMP